MPCDTCHWAFHTTFDRHVCGIPNGIAFWSDVPVSSSNASCYTEGEGVKVTCQTCRYNKDNACGYRGEYQCVIQENLVRRAYRQLNPGSAKKGTLAYDTIC